MWLVISNEEPNGQDQGKERTRYEDMLWGQFHTSSAAFPTDVLLCFLLERICSEPQGKKNMGGARTEGTFGWNTMAKTDKGVGALSSASDFYFWLTFLVSGWLDRFCRDPLCFKQKYGTTHHVLARTRTCVFICGNEFAEPLNFLLSWVVAQDVCLWHWIQRTFIYLLGCWTLKFG